MLLFRLRGWPLYFHISRFCIFKTCVGKPQIPRKIWSESLFGWVSAWRSLHWFWHTTMRPIATAWKACLEKKMMIPVVSPTTTRISGRDNHPSTECLLTTQDVLQWLWRRRSSRGSQLAQLAVHQEGRVQGLSDQTFNKPCIFKTKPASGSRFAQQVEGDDQLRSWRRSSTDIH